MNDFPVFFSTLSSDVVFEIFDPSVTFFPMETSALLSPRGTTRTGSEYVLLRVEHVPEQNTSASLIDADRQWLVLCFGLDDRALLVSTIRFGCRVICTRKLPHQRISAIIVEIDSSNVCIIEGTSTSSAFLIVTASSTIEGATRTTCL